MGGGRRSSGHWVLVKQATAEQAALGRGDVGPCGRKGGWLLCGRACVRACVREQAAASSTGQ